MNLSKLSKKELSDLASQKKIKNRSKMNKDELVKALQQFFTVTDTDKSTTTPNATSSQLGYTEQQSKEPKVIKRDEYPIPPYYNKDMISLLPVDPSSEYAYWELSDHTLSSVRQRFDLPIDYKLTLKVFAQNGDKVIELASAMVDRIGSWYFNLNAASMVIWTELGAIDKDGVFHSILKSKLVKMPADGVSNIVDEETWLTIGGDLDKLYKLSGVGMRDANSSINIHEEVIKQTLMHAGSSNLSISKDL